MTMKKYEVTLYYHTNVTVVVEAENEDEALEKGCDEAADEKYNFEVLANCVEDSDPTVEEVED